jgi:predicted O-methyltransferase YrrM
MINWLGLHREYLQPGEMEHIVNLVRSVEARTMVEIGCRDGRTAAVILHNVKSLIRYIGIDVAGSYVPRLEHQLKEMVAEPGHLAQNDFRFELMIRPRGSLDVYPTDLPACDVVFIDGDHSEEVAMHDSILANSVVRPGGIIIWHDAGNVSVEVEKVLDSLQGQGWPIEVVSHSWLAVCRM